MSNEEARLEELVRFGVETEQFLKSNIGRYLLDRSKEEIEAAVQGLKVVDPYSGKPVQDLQNIIRRNEGVEQWLGEIIQSGWDARNLLAGEEL
jgi:hypothetical protein